MWKKQFPVAVVTFCLALGGAGTPLYGQTSPGHTDPAFVPGSGADSVVYAAALQPDGKVLLGGNFSTVAGVACNRIARLNSDGSLDNAFTCALDASGYVYRIVLQPDGKILIGGSFNSVGGVARTNLARLNPDGSLDSSFALEVAAGGFVQALALQADGAVLVGNFTGVSRYNHLGAPDSAFAVPLNNLGAVTALAVQPDGRILIGGGFTYTVNSVTRLCLARLHSDGSFDPSFDPGTGADNYVSALALQRDGKVLVGGNFSAVHGTSRVYLARLNPDGGLDPGFTSPLLAPMVAGKVQTIVLQPDGKIIVGGIFAVGDALSRRDGVRLNVNGSVDASFDSEVVDSGSFLALAQQPDGKVVVGGVFTSLGGVARNNVARIFCDFDPVFDPALTRRLGDGRFQLVLQGMPGSNYVVQTSGDLAPSTWTPFVTNSMPASGLVTNTDSAASGLDRRFYRATTP